MLLRIMRAGIFTPTIFLFMAFAGYGQAFEGPTDKINDPVKSIAEDTVLPARYDGVVFHRVVDTPAEIHSGSEVIDIMIEYPESALEAGIEATVYVDAYVDNQGEVAAVKLRDGGVQGFNHAAVNAADKLQFIPAQRSGEAVNSIVTLPIEFEIPDDGDEVDQIRSLE